MDRNPPAFLVTGLGGRSEGEVVVLDEEESRHVRSLRLVAGDVVALTDGLGTRRSGCLGSAAGRQRQVTVGGPLPAGRPLDVELAISVGNRTHMLWLIEKATEFGVRRIAPVETERSRSVSDAGRSEGFRAKAVRRAIAALKQSGGSWLPEIAPIEDLSAFLARAGRSGTRTVVLDAGGEPLRAVLPDPAESVVLLVGPEGGLTRAELESSVEAGFLPCRLASTILRFETAAVAALAVVAQEREIAGMQNRNHEGDAK